MRRDREPAWLHKYPTRKLISKLMWEASAAEHQGAAVQWLLSIASTITKSFEFNGFTLTLTEAVQEGYAGVMHALDPLQVKCNSDFAALVTKKSRRVRVGHVLPAATVKEIFADVYARDARSQLLPTAIIEILVSMVRNDPLAPKPRRRPASSALLKEPPPEA